MDPYFLCYRYMCVIANCEIIQRDTAWSCKLHQTCEYQLYLAQLRLCNQHDMLNLISNVILYQTIIGIIMNIFMCLYIGVCLCGHWCSDNAPLLRTWVSLTCLLGRSIWLHHHIDLWSMWPMIQSTYDLGGLLIYRQANLSQRWAVWLQLRMGVWLHVQKRDVQQYILPWTLWTFITSKPCQ